MSHVDRQVRAAQRRLWINRWLHHLGWWLLFTAAAWVALLIIVRLFAFEFPIPAAALTGLGICFAGASVTWAMSREPRHLAAVALDNAAGLKERVSSSLLLQPDSPDPFAQAVHADADRSLAGLSAKRCIPLRWPMSLSWSAALLVVALLSMALPDFDILGRKQAKADQSIRQTALQEVRTAVAKPVSAIQSIAESQKDPELSKELNDLQNTLKNERDPDALRRETAKKLDRVGETLKAKADSERFKAFEETRKRLKQLGQPEDPKSEAGRLMENLSSGDIQEARENVKKMQEQLAKASRDGKMSPEQVAKMQDQLNDLAKKLEEAAKDKETRRELQNAGIDEKQVERVLEALSKKDPKQLEKMAKELEQRLKEKGISKEQIKQMMDKMKQRQAASEACQKMSDKMAQAGAKLQKGDTEAAQDELGEADEMLSEMEQTEQTLNDLEGQMAELDQARDEMNDSGEQDKECPDCKGTGFHKTGGT